MTEGEPGPWKNFDRRLARARRAHGMEGKDAERRSEVSDLAIAWRIGVELVVSILVGAGIGWAIDQWLGTAPWAMVAMVFLGFAAGVANVFRLALGMERAVGYGPPKEGAPKPPPPPPSEGDWSDDEDEE
jgi:ATP synthase protein I